ncbi:MAG: helix-turn-helix transcriptional regulator [bacterium]|nr:helix-turn-helix transcriptional regulator [bacterium]
MTRLDIDRLKLVSDRLGEAVLDPARWPDLMEDICGASGSIGACLLQSDIRTPDVPMTASTREYFKSYFDEQFNVNDVRAIRAVPLLLAGRAAVNDQDIFASETEMLRDPLYVHLGTHDLRWFTAVGFFAGSALWGLSIQRTVSEGAFEESEKRALGALTRRLTETATLSKAVGRTVLSGVTNAFGFIRKAAISIDRLGAVIEANAAAEAIFDDDLFIADGGLSIRDKNAQRAFADFLAQLKVTPDVRPLNVAPIVVRRSRKRPVIIHVLPVDGAARSPFLGGRAILVLSDMQAPQTAQLDLLCRAFDLTPSEGRIALFLAEGKSPEEAAQEFVISRETVRAHLKAIFRKTDTHRQGELIALIGRLR